MRPASDNFLSDIKATLSAIEGEGLYKRERTIVSAQGAEITVREAGRERKVLNFCANNYLGLANHPEVIAAAKATMDSHGFGMASVRFICGTQDLHRQAEQEIAGWLGYDDAILYAACFDANGGVFEPLLEEQDAIVSDSLNHASIIDGVRLCKAKRFRFANSDMADLEAKLKEAKAASSRRILIVTDGVFSMDGYIAKLKEICDLADRFGALVMVDDSHALGFLGANGRGSPEFCGVEGRIDILSGTLGKALGGAMGGFIAAKQPVIDLLRQRSRPYLFSNSVAPPVIAGSLKAIELAKKGGGLRQHLFANAKLFRRLLGDAGFKLLPGEHPIVPVMIGDAAKAQKLAARLLEEGIYVIGFSFPVVPRGQARIRTQLSAAHATQHVEAAAKAFIAAGKAEGVI